MKRFLSAALLAAMCFMILAGCATTDNGPSVSVEAVSNLVGAGSVGLMDRYAGKVVAGETAEVKRDSDKAIYETYVEEGDMVQAGDMLFSYDTEALQLSLDKLYLEKEQLENTITSAEATIADLEKQKAKAKESEQLSYTLQIDGKNADIREAKYNIALKERDIAAMEDVLENADIFSPIAGRVMTIDENGNSNNYYYGYDDGSSSNGVKYITITDVTRLRVQGNISEMNAYALMEGMPMTVRSRLDNSLTWQGTLSMIDWSNPVSNNNNDGYGMVYVSGGDSDEMTTASKYPFYIELDGTDGLMLGQHVYIEPDTGDGETDEPAGPMLPSYYIAYDEDGEAYVWAAGSRDKLEKRAVTLGMYDESMDLYEIVEGLTEDDYIAFPMEDLQEGQSVEKYDPSAETEGDVSLGG